MNFKDNRQRSKIIAPKENLPAVNRRIALIIILLLVSAVFMMRMMTPDDLRNRDQVKVCAYILDASYNNNWICQVDSYGAITSKPPLYNWIGALMVLIFGANRFAFALPALFGTMLAAWAVWRWTLDLTRDERSAWLAILCYLATNAVIKQTALVRTDGLFTGFVALCAWQAWRAWETDQGWWRVWFLATLGTLTKGPFAILLGLGGLFAVFWNKGTLPHKGLTRKWWHGVILPVVLAGGWALIAWHVMGQAFYDKIFVSELWDQSVGTGLHLYRLVSSIKPPLYLLSRALPWAPLFVWALWYVFRRPAADPGERRGERYIMMHIGIGILALMLAQHKRGDLIFPLLPAVAVLEGRMMGIWSHSWHWPKLKTMLTIFTAVFMVFEIWYLEVPRANEKEDVLGRENKAFAQKLENKCGLFFPFSFASSHDLQYRLGVTRFAMTPEQAVNLIAGREAAFIVTEKLPELISLLPAGIKYHVLARDTKHPYGVLSNRSKLEIEPDMVVAAGKWELHTRDVMIRRMRGTTVWIEPEPGGRLTLENFGVRPESLRLVLPNGKVRRIHTGGKSSVSITADTRSTRGT